MTRLIIPALVALLVSGGFGLRYAEAASAERTDQLLWECTGKEMEEIGQLSCGRFIDGMMDMSSLFVGAGAKPFFCPPPQGISVDQAMRIFIAWANRHPKELHETARTSVLIALRDAFPCKK